MARGSAGVRKRGEGGERATRVQAKEEDSREFESVNMPGTWMANKRTQVEMTRLATMRAEEKRQGSRRSGKRPNLEGAWEGRGQQEGVERVKWEDLTRSQRKNRSRKALGKSKKVNRGHMVRKENREGARGRSESARGAVGGREEESRLAVAMGVGERHEQGRHKSISVRQNSLSYTVQKIDYTSFMT